METHLRGGEDKRGHSPVQAVRRLSGTWTAGIAL